MLRSAGRPLEKDKKSSASQFEMAVTLNMHTHTREGTVKATTGKSPLF